MILVLLNGPYRTVHVFLFVSIYICWLVLKTNYKYGICGKNLSLNFVNICYTFHMNNSSCIATMFYNMKSRYALRFHRKLYIFAVCASTKIKTF